jgi:hypothetical protein
MKKLNIVGEKYGRLTVLEEVTLPGGRSSWKCKCDCGNTTVVKLDKLRGGKTKSCGCLNLELSSLRAEKMYSKNRKYTPLEASARRVWQKRYGEMEFEDFLEMSQQDCYYCGESLINIQNCAGSKSSEDMKKNGIFIYNGLDRVDNNKPHSKENCVPCCKYCNYAKRDLILKKFIQWGIKAYNHICKNNNS